MENNILNKLVSRLLIFYYFILRNWNLDEDALDKCNLILKYDYYNEIIWNIMGDIYRNLELFDESICCYEKVLEITQYGYEKIRSLTKISDLLYELEDYEDCLSYLNKLSEIEGCEDYIIMNMANCYYGMEDYKNALSYYQKCYVDEDNIPCRLYISECYYKLYEFDKADNILNELLSLYPESPDILYEKLCRIENYEDTISLCDVIINLKCDSNDPFVCDMLNCEKEKHFNGIKADAYFVKSDEMLEKKHDIESALKYRLSGLKLKTDYLEIYNVAKLYFDLNNLEKSQEYLISYLDQFPYDEECLFYMGRIYEIKRDYLLAKEYYMKVLNENNECEKALNRMKKVDEKLAG